MGKLTVKNFARNSRKAPQTKHSGELKVDNTLKRIGLLVAFLFTIVLIISVFDSVRSVFTEGYVVLEGVKIPMSKFSISTRTHDQTASQSKFDKDSKAFRDWVWAKKQVSLSSEIETVIISLECRKRGIEATHEQLLDHIKYELEHIGADDNLIQQAYPDGVENADVEGYRSQMEERLLRYDIAAKILETDIESIEKLEASRSESETGFSLLMWEFSDELPGRDEMRNIIRSYLDRIESVNVHPDLLEGAIDYLK